MQLKEQKISNHFLFLFHFLSKVHLFRYYQLHWDLFFLQFHPYC